MPVALPLSKLKTLCNPFGRQSPWGVALTQAHVRQALQEGRLVATPGGDDHAARIAYLVVNKAQDPINLDVGCPGLGYPGPSWPVLDGNHRLAAAIFRRDAIIQGTVDGDLAHAEHLLGVDCEEARAEA